MSSSKSSSSSLPAGPVLRAVVRQEEAGLRLDRWLGDRPEVSSREMARRLIEQGAVFLNHQPEAPATRVRADDEVAYAFPAPTPLDTPAEDGPLDVLYEDDWLAVISKPPGLSMHPGPGHPAGTLVNRLLFHCGGLSGIGGKLRPGIVHRLDLDTSGVVVIAKHDEAHVALAAQFKAHSVSRAYLAVTVGVPPTAAGAIDMALGRHPKNRLKRAPDPNGKRAVTHWSMVRAAPPFAVVRLRLETGRTHQIRVHLSQRGWPVLGDPLYGGHRERGHKLPEPLKAIVEAFPRQALHAEELGFAHPRDGKALRFTCPPPADMAALLTALEALDPPEGTPRRR